MSERHMRDALDLAASLVEGDGLYFVAGRQNGTPTIYRLDFRVGLPEMGDRDRAVARALALLAVERLEVP